MNRLFATMLFSALVFCSCSNDVSTAGGESVRFLTAEPRTTVTRTWLTDNSTGGLSAGWSKGDKLRIINLTVPNREEEEMVYAQSTATSTRFTGYVSCKQGDELLLFYPATNGASCFDYDDNGTFRLSLHGQDGTLAKIASNFDFCYSTATVSAVDNFKASASFGSFTNIVSILRITTNLGGVTSLKLSGTGLDATRIYDTNTATLTKFKDFDFIRVTNEGGLTTFYVAIFPADNLTIDLEATNGDGTFTSQIAEANYAAGGYYIVNATF